jgi:NarL family two-component system response regulator YdfI
VIRVFIVAASPTARAALQNLFHRQSSARRNGKSREHDASPSLAVEIVGTGADLNSLEGRELDGGLDVVLIDASGNHAASILADIRDTDIASDLPIVLLSDHASPVWSAQALHDGIRAILPADIAANQLLAALQAAAAGLVVLHPADISAAIPTTAIGASNGQSQAELTESLTRREREVLQMLAAGLGNKEIAARLNISDHTAKFHVASILGKLSATTRTEAVAVGIRHGLILL